MVRLEGLGVAYRVGREGRLSAIEGVDASFPEGSLTALIGPSGCGKTSLLAAMAGLLPPSAGRILVHGEEQKGVRDRSAVIFQDGGLLPWKTVRGNAELPLRLRAVPAAERRRRVDPILEELGLLDFASFWPARLSGGMRQRLGVARALACEPDLLLMDEPFSSLDALTRESLQDGLLEVRRRHLVTIVLVTHSIEEAAYLADRAYILAGKTPGKVAAFVDWSGSDGSPQAPAPAPVPAPRGRGYRASSEYFERCALLRRSFEEAVATAASPRSPAATGRPA